VAAQAVLHLEDGAPGEVIAIDRHTPVEVLGVEVRPVKASHVSLK
jgi:hypothetical protein